MKPRKTGFLIWLFLLPLLVSFAQGNKQLLVSVLPVFGSTPVSPGNVWYKLNPADSVKFETFKFYMSGVELLLCGKSVWKESDSYHLIDATESTSMRMVLEIGREQRFDHIQFLFGIDSLTNVSGVKGGALDPTKGMYWTWDNGYINARLEGNSNLCKTRNQEFQIHIGGYRKGVNTARRVTLPVKGENSMRILVDLKPVLQELDLAKTHHLMSPGKEAVFISDLLSHYFKTE